MVKRIEGSQKIKKKVTRFLQKPETKSGKLHNERFAAKPPVEQSKEKSYAVFQVGREKFCVELDLIHEIIHTFSVHAAPHLSKVYTGIINLRGDSMPVVDLCRLLHEEKIAKGIRTCFVASIGSSRVGFLVDSDLEIVTTKKGRLYTLPDCYDKEESKFLDGIFWRGDDFIGVLKPQELVSIRAKQVENDEEV